MRIYAIDVVIISTTIVDKRVLTYAGVRNCLRRVIISQVDIPCTSSRAECDRFSVPRRCSARCSIVAPSELLSRTRYVLGCDDSKALKGLLCGIAMAKARAHYSVRCRVCPRCDGEPGRIAVDIISTLSLVPVRREKGVSH